MATRIYLAGGMKTAWREVLKEAVERALLVRLSVEAHGEPVLLDAKWLVRWIDPADHSLVSPEAFVPADLALVSSCDLLVVYIENADFSPIGAAVEMGYAKSDRTLILYYEEPGRGESLRFMKNTADIVAESADELGNAIVGLIKAGL